MHKCTRKQAAIVASLLMDGFQIVERDLGNIVVHRGNDYRIVWNDGSQHRALGAQGKVKEMCHGR